MKTIKIISRICFGWAVVLGINSCNSSQGHDLSKKSIMPGENTVTIQAMQFQPSTLTVVPGSEITWINMDTTSHTVVSDNGISFISGPISPKGSYNYSANQNGSITYHCSMHPQMKGTIQVVTR